MPYANADDRRARQRARYQERKAAGVLVPPSSRSTGAPAGRPASAPADRRDQRVNVYLTAAEVQALDAILHTLNTTAAGVTYAAIKGRPTGSTLSRSEVVTYALRIWERQVRSLPIW